ncbi:MAG: class I SAM-dependent methyltransferase [Myxococcaceae bacterium]
MNPQLEQMADESMVRTLAAQVEAIWPQEVGLLKRYGFSGGISVLDAGCGTGEATFKLAELYPQAKLLGVDIIDASLARGRQKCAAFGERVRFENRSVFELKLPDASFDLVVSRHVIHSIPHPEKVLAELKRVTKKGGRLHVIAEDYGMIHFPDRSLSADRFWYTATREFGEKIGIDHFIGRRTPSLFKQLGLKDVTVDYVVVDPLRVPAATFTRIFQAWCDGFARPIGENTSISEAQAKAHFADMLATLADPNGYGVWQVPVVSGVV